MANLDRRSPLPDMPVSEHAGKPVGQKCEKKVLGINHSKYGGDHHGRSFHAKTERMLAHRSSLGPFKER